MKFSISFTDLYIQVSRVTAFYVGYLKTVRFRERKPYIVYRMVPFSVTLSDFKVATFVEDEYLKNGATWGQSYFSTLIRNHAYME